ncbi:hypothetical protein [Streptomyces sp. NPDC091371]|uniref:hypothetical protein n=1 Tax=Streptomyces sp. NPDC091371 TaxID=3155303 RepID=UPI0034158BFE
MPTPLLRRPPIAVCLASAAALLFPTATADAAPAAGEASRSTATPGVVTWAFPKAAAAAAAAADRSPDGQIAVAVNTRNGITLVRFDARGKFDKSFGTNGYARLAADNVSAAAVAFDEDGSLTVAGTAPGKGTALLARLTARGKPDTSFGKNGIVVTQGLPASTEAAALAVQSDGKPVLAATAKNRVVVARYTLKGRPDPSFGTKGRYLSPAKVSESAAAIGLQEDGTIVVAGSSTLPKQGERASLWSLTTKGAPSPGFGTTGKLLVAAAVRNGVSRNMVIDSADNIVMSGSADSHYAVVRHRPGGARDRDFGDDGLARIPTTDTSNGTVVAAAEDGHVVTAGPLGTALGVASATTQGQPDPGFGTSGVTTLDFGTAEQSLSALLLTEDGQVIVVGTAGTRIALARFTPHGKPDSTYGR